MIRQHNSCLYEGVHLISLGRKVQSLWDRCIRSLLPSISPCCRFMAWLLC